MSNQNLRYLFLHFGPGGNAGLERLWLQNYSSLVDFWDQPTNVSTFDELSRQCVDRYNSGNYKGIIAHSFGCDLAFKISQKLNIPIEMHFISPLRDIPTAFINLAHNLAAEAESGDRKIQLTEAAQKMKATPNWEPGKNLSPADLNQFVQLVMAAGADPNYYRAFWFQPEKLKAFEHALPKIPQLDQTCWQNVMIDFLVNHQAKEKAVKAQVYVGVEDPYFGLLRDEKSYWEKSGANFVSLEKTGHYPHLESNVFELLVKRT